MIPILCQQLGIINWKVIERYNHFDDQKRACREEEVEPQNQKTREKTNLTPLPCSCQMSNGGNQEPTSRMFLHAFVIRLMLPLLNLLKWGHFTFESWFLAYFEKKMKIWQFWIHILKMATEDRAPCSLPPFRWDACSLNHCNVEIVIHSLYLPGRGRSQFLSSKQRQVSMLSYHTQTHRIVWNLIETEDGVGGKQGDSERSTLACSDGHAYFWWMRNWLSRGSHGHAGKITLK